jgi:hypothetical protein|nr:MAG TPA: hypothetical protein [Caudoviricetes sp.]
MEENQKNEDVLVLEQLIDKLKDTIGALQIQNIELSIRLQLKNEELTQYKLEQDLIAHQEELKKGLDHE